MFSYDHRNMGLPDLRGTYSVPTSKGKLEELHFKGFNGELEGGPTAFGDDKPEMLLEEEKIIASLQSPRGLL